MRSVTLVAVAAVSMLLPVGSAAKAKATTSPPPTASLTTAPVAPRTSDAVTVTVADAPPVGDYTWGPDRTPLSGDLVRFTATGVDDPNDGAAAVSIAWDLDDDGTFETTGPAAETRFRSPGPHTVALQLVDPAGQSTVIRHTVTVANRAPVAAFDVAPAAPAPGQDITLTSRASDPDGGTMQLQQDWDLNDDGQFDDATGPVVHLSFAEGQHVVRLRVTDGDGGVAIAESTLVVAAPAQGAAASAANASSSALEPAQLGLLPMMPFPVVRLRGQVTRQGVVVDLLSVTAPAGSQIRLRCMGPGCPSAGRVVSLRSLRSLHHALRPGVILEVRVARPGSIGKLVRFTIGRGRPPVRFDGCVNGAGAPMECS